MKFSKHWLQEYIIENLPEDETIERELNAKAFEVEGIEEYVVEGKKWDSIFDIKVLPNRAHDALGHAGMARELCACLSLTFNPSPVIYPDIHFDEAIEKVTAEVADSKACSRFMAVRIDGVRVEQSPTWLRMKLESIGQRSINNIVDITNYVQYTLNKPMHAYDAKSIDGSIVVRYANEGEKLETLDDRELILNKDRKEKVLVIADNKKALGLAGIKGGKWSGINGNTNSIIIESANFDPSLIRKTSQKYNIKTDASKRFENGIANSLVADGLMMTIGEVLKMFPDAKVGEVTDVMARPIKQFKVGISVDKINQVLGANYSAEEIEDTFKKLGFKYEKVIPKESIEKNIQLTIGKPYKRDASVAYDAPEYFSCGSVTNWLYRECGYYELPRMAVDQFVFAKPVDREGLCFGDLIFTNTLVEKPKNQLIFSQVLGVEIADVATRKESVEYMRGTRIEHGLDHVGMYVGDNKVLHASSLNGDTRIEDLNMSECFKHQCWYGRVAGDLNELQYLIYIPNERLDIRRKEDLVEEVGRIIGYDTLKPILPMLSRVGKVNKKLYYQNVIRNILIDSGFSEVITYSFVSEGVVELVKSASDKNKLRTNISAGLIESLQKNINNMPLLNVNEIAVFEFGNCFTHDREWASFALAIDDGKKKSNFTGKIESIKLEIKNALNLSEDVFESHFEIKNTKPLVSELDFDALVETLPEPTENIYLDSNINKETKYKTFSQMPFVVRDVAFWADSSVDTMDIENMIREKAGELCVSINPFDKFVKDDKTSYGYRLVYQDKDRTLTDIEVNGYAENVYNALKERGFEIR